MNKKVSVIVPVYNVELYLEQCLDSIVNQTYKDLEIILIDDGSNDKSGKICDTYAKKDSRIIIIHKKNGGVSSARNVGLTKSTGHYIMFVDSDDWLAYDAICSLVEIQKRNEYDVIMFGAYHENLILNSIQRSHCKNQSFNNSNEIRGIIPALIKTEKINSLWNKMYKSSIIKDNNIIFEETISIAEDALFNFQISLKANSYCILDKCFYHYIIREAESLTKRYNPRKYDMLIFVNDYIQQELKKYPNHNEAIKASKHIRVKNIYSCFLDLFCKQYALPFKDKKLIIKEIIEKEANCGRYYSDNLLYKVLILIIYSKNIYLIYLATYIVSRLR